MMNCSDHTGNSGRFPTHFAQAHTKISPQMQRRYLASEGFWSWQIFPGFFWMPRIRIHHEDIGDHTVDGKNPAPVDRVNIPLFTGVSYIPGG